MPRGLDIVPAVQIGPILVERDPILLASSPIVAGRRVDPRKLLSRLVNRAVPVEFDDGEGGVFAINVRLASPEIRRLYGELQMETLEAMKAKDFDRVKKIEDFVSGFLGKLCVDESFDKEFWAAGKGFDVEVPTKLLNASMGLSSDMLETAEFFRDDRLGKGPSTEA